MTLAEHILYSLPLLCCMAAVAALLLKRCRTLAQGYLTLCLGVLSLILLVGYFNDVFKESADALLRTINYCLTTACAISVLLYFVALMQPRKLTRRYLSTWSAVLLLYGIIITAPLLVPERFAEHGRSEKFDTYLRLFDAACNISLELYTITAVIFMYYRHRRYLRRTYSYDKEINLRWVFWSNAVFILMAVNDVIWKFKADTKASILFNLMILAYIIAVFWLGYTHGDAPQPSDEELQEMEENS